MSWYLSIHKTNIRECVSSNRYKTMVEMEDHARKREIGSETQTKEKRQILATSQPATRRSKHIDSRYRRQKGPSSNMYGKTQEGSYHVLIYYKCSKERNYSLYVNRTAWGLRICFHYNQVGYIMVNFPLPKLTCAIQVPAPTKLKITNERQSGLEAPKAKV